MGDDCAVVDEKCEQIVLISSAAIHMSHVAHPLPTRSHRWLVVTLVKHSQAREFFPNATVEAHIVSLARLLPRGPPLSRTV